MCKNCVGAGDKEFSFATYAALRRIAREDDEPAEDGEDAAALKNCLKFFAYYLSVTAGVTLKCLSALISL